jgi:hypothetical protein
LDEDHIVDALEWSRGIFHGKLSERHASILYSASEPTAVEDKQLVVPAEFVLQQNYPNPFNPTTTIPYALSRKAQVRLSIYDLLGREVRVLVNAEQPAGTYSVSFNAVNLAGGIYFYQMQAQLTNGFRYISRKKLILIK